MGVGTFSDYTYAKTLKCPSALQTPSTLKKLPKVRMLKINKIKEFVKRDKINTFDNLNANHAPSEQNYHKTNDYIIFYEIVYDKKSGFSRVEKKY